MTTTREIRADYLARVEGEGAMYVRIKGGEVEEVKLRIFEPPRFFEAFLRGRDFREVPDITARICGICPVAYQMSSVQAMEQACGVKVDGQLRALRRLLYCGEWIESHVLHAFMLHAPDFLGYESALEMAKDHKEVVETALKLKKIGNDVMVVVGGREIHPINVKVGGFYRVPRKRELKELVPRLQWALEESVKAAKLFAGFPIPELERDYVFVSLGHPTDYPLYDGNVTSGAGLDAPVEEYEDFFAEMHAVHSNALHSHMRAGGAYFVGPNARFSLHAGKLTPAAAQTAREIGLKPPCRNPFRSILVRAVETVYACEEALRLIEAYEEPDRPEVTVAPRAGRGAGASEAPRGLLYHRYEIDEEGHIVSAKITPPTAQNQPTIEEDLLEFVKTRTDLPDAQLQWQCEQAIRNYDPCISCATHFLDLTVDRG